METEQSMPGRRWRSRRLAGLRRRKDLNGLRVLITGGSKGIGRQTALLLASLGCRLVISGRNADALERTRAELAAAGAETLAIVSDVTRAEDCRTLVENAVQHFGGLDVLINNAGMSMRGNFLQTDLELFERIMDINFTGAVHMSRHALPHLVESRGSILFVSSISGLYGLPGIAPYSAAKMALTALAQSLQAELSGRVHVGILYVSFTENDPGKVFYSSRGEELPLVRKKNSSSQADVARALVAMLRSRRRRRVMTTVGNLADLVFRLFPVLSGRLIGRFAAGSSMYAHDINLGSERKSI